MAQSRRWCFTYQLPENEDPSVCVSKCRSSDKLRGIACQLELAPTTKRAHIQGYTEWDSPIRLAALKKLLRSAHWEVAKGTRKQCVDYCSKSESVVGGDQPTFRIIDSCLLEEKTRGKRTDLIELGKAISSGDLTREEVYSERPDLILKFNKGVQELFRYREQFKNRGNRMALSVIVIYGDAGTGKTRYAYGDGSNVFLVENSNSDNLWWDGYNGESTIIIDDFYGWIRHNVLLRLLDIYPVRLDVKGGTTYAGWTTVYITSNKHPSEWYKKFPWVEDEALQRRIHKCYHAIKGKSIWMCDKTDDIIKHNFN